MLVIGDYWTKSPTFNPQIVITLLNVHASFFISSGFNCKMASLQYLNRNDKPQFPYHQSWFHYQSVSFNKWTTIYAELWETKLLQAELARNPQCHQYNEYSAKEKADTSKYSTEVLQLSYLLHHLYNHR